VLLVRAAGEQSDSEREDRFLTELELALDGFAVEAVRPEDAGFADLALRRQVELVRPLLAERGALAATWVDAASPDLLLLHLVSVSTGRALVRLVETERGADSLSELALVVRELLGEAYMFEADAVEQGDAMARAVADARRSAGAPVTTRRPEYRLFATANARGGIATHTGPSVLLGGSFGVERVLVPMLSMRVWLGGHGGPLGRSDEAEIDIHCASLGVGVAYLWRLGRIVSTGPSVGVEAQVAWLRFDLGVQDDFRYTRFLAQGLTEWELRVGLGRRVELAAGGGLGFSPSQEVFRRESTGAEVLATPFVGWTARAGLTVLLNPAG
jgi:hypothetical protein